MTTPVPPAPRWPDTIQRYLNEGSLDQVPATREEVDALWQKAGVSASDASQPNLKSIYDADTATPDAATAALAAMRTMLPEAGASLAPLLPALPLQQSIATTAPKRQTNPSKKGPRG